MAVETELKLRIAPEHLTRLKRHAILKSHQIKRPVTRHLYNIYYDTPKLDLQNSGMALRLRRVGQQWLQTLKGGGSVKGGLHQRNEWEAPVSGAALDFSVLDQAVWDEQVPASWRKKLQPVFLTDFSRSSRMLQWQGAQIELCIDQGEVRTEQHSTPICELELELLSGEPGHLFELALAILDVVPFELETVSKAERGYRLLSGHVEGPVKSAAPDIAESNTLPDVLQSMIWSCLQHLQSNLHGAMTSDDAEYLHQMRVALRRLRVALRLTGKLRTDEELATLSRDAAALGVALGNIREWDVFMAGTAQPMCQRMAGHGGLQALLAASERQRDAAYAALRNDARSRELQRLLLRFALWLNGPYWQAWQEEGAAAPLVHDFAVRHLRKLYRRFARAGQQLNGLDADRLHALRIVAKKLRYTTEFFAPLFDRKKARTFLRALSEVQDLLGQINDVAVAHRLLDELAAMPDLASHQEAVILAKGWIAHDLSHLLLVLRKTVQRFDKQSVLWGK
ncbi:MAG TPA: CHAD domain-containing protein [Gallionella sp.]|nr:CHAD domain-containing protein [Gallionella sp.]